MDIAGMICHGPDLNVFERLNGRLHSTDKIFPLVVYNLPRCPGKFLVQTWNRPRLSEVGHWKTSCIPGSFQGLSQGLDFKMWSCWPGNRLLIGLEEWFIGVITEHLNAHRALVPIDLAVSWLFLLVVTSQIGSCFCYTWFPPKFGLGHT